MSMNRLIRSTALALAAVLAPSAALACGGFFCSQTPVDQSAERIIFRQPDAETVESLIEIRYQGDPQQFAWIVPVPGIPSDLATVSATVFQHLDVATMPTFQLPPECQLAFATNGPGAEGDGAGGSRDVDPPGVDVLQHVIVGDYDLVTVKADDGRVLVEWLRTNGYRIVDEMAPFIDLYIGQGLNFVAAKLVPGAGADAIKPLKMTYKSSQPMVPLRLTSIAAQPEMGVKIFLLGEGRYTSESVPELEVPAGQVVVDAFTQQSNWEAAVARTIDGAQGEGLVGDFAGPAEGVAETVRNGFVAPIGDEDVEVTRAETLALLAGARYVTRLYGRFSPEEMGVDLTFVAAPELPDIDRNHLVELAQVPGCYLQDGSTIEQNPCAYLACGQGGLCVMAPDEFGDLVPGCACVDGASARAVADQSGIGRDSVACIDMRMNVDPIRIQLPEMTGEDPQVVPNLPDPCLQAPCGDHGTCVSINAQQTCQCEHDYVAVARRDENGKVRATCQPADAPVPADFYRRSLPEPRLPFPGKALQRGKVSNDGCSVTAPVGRPGGLAALLPLLGAAALLRRRRR